MTSAGPSPSSREEEQQRWVAAAEPVTALEVAFVEALAGAAPVILTDDGDAADDDDADDAVGADGGAGEGWRRSQQTGE